MNHFSKIYLTNNSLLCKCEMKGKLIEESHDLLVNNLFENFEEKYA